MEQCFEVLYCREVSDFDRGFSCILPCPMRYYKDKVKERMCFHGLWHPIKRSKRHSRGRDRAGDRVYKIYVSIAFCINLANTGMDPKTLQYIMGHSNVTMTLNFSPYLKCRGNRKYRLYWHIRTSKAML